MTRGPEDKFPGHGSGGYRAARRAFIAACEAAGADVIGRVHPGKAPDGGPLFLDTAAFGARDAAKGLLVITDGAEAAALKAVLGAGFAERLPASTRLVLLHALDPWAAAWQMPGPDAANPGKEWPLRMLRAVATEDLCRCQAVRVLARARGAADGEPLITALRQALPSASLALLPPADGDLAAQIEAALMAP